MKRVSSAAVAVATLLVLCHLFSVHGFTFNSRVQDGSSDWPAQEPNVAGSRFQGQTETEGSEEDVKEEKEKDWPRADIITDISDGHANRYRRQVVPTDRNLWPDGDIVYTVLGVLANQTRPMEVIKSAIKYWEDRTCIRFRYVPQDDVDKFIPRTRTYVVFKNSSTCCSYVGKLHQTGAQDVNMGPGCINTFMLIRQFGHLIGLGYEQSRRDRDAHILILWKNIKDQVLPNFKKVKMARLLTPYDLSSMMHYGMKTYTKNDQPTLKPIDPRLAPLIGRRNDLSFYDMKVANILYKCAANCSNSHPCLNDGFRLANCRCKCPDGLVGVQCEKVDTDTECGGVVEVRGEMTITSPGFPAASSSNMRCVWLLRSPGGTYMALNLLDIDVDVNDKKDKLVLRYHNIGVEKGPQFSRDDVNSTVESVDNKAIIQFNTGSTNIRKGFQIKVDVHPLKDCKSSPCQHGGRCEEVPAINTYVCNCRPGWIGKDCHIPIVDGGFSAWSLWEPCVASCGMQSRNRSCTDPIPRNGGTKCEGPTLETRHCGDPTLCDDYFNCDFGSEGASTTCGLRKDQSPQRLAWMVTSGKTPSSGTGPPGGHTTGDPGDMYYYLEASRGRSWQKAISWLPHRRLTDGYYCLEFFYSLHGTSVSTLTVLRRVKGRGTSIVWQHTGEEGSQWRVAHVTVKLDQNVQLGFMAVKGKTYSSDIGIDDISISPGKCQTGFRSDKQQDNAECCYKGIPVRRGQFKAKVIEKGCTQITCFCNQDGLLDCPPWKEAPCENSKTGKLGGMSQDLTRKTDHLKQSPKRKMRIFFIFKPKVPSRGP